MVNFYGTPERPTRFQGKTAEDLIRARDTVQEIMETVELTENEQAALEVAKMCMIKVSEQLKI